MLTFVLFGWVVALSTLGACHNSFFGPDIQVFNYLDSLNLVKIWSKNPNKGFFALCFTYVQKTY